MPAPMTTSSSRSPTRSCRRACGRWRGAARPADDGPSQARRRPDRARRDGATCHRRRRAVDLSPREFSLLECLLRHPGQTLTRDQLLDQAWPFSVAVTPNAVDAYVHYLRDKLGSAGRLIETVRGVGYRLADA